MRGRLSAVDGDPQSASMIAPEIEDSGLLDGLTGPARAERAELVAWLLGQGFTVEQIGASLAPMMLVSRRLMGADDNYISANDIVERTGLDLDLIRRVQRAIGLPTVDDPDAAVYLAADADTMAHVAKFLTVGADPEVLLQALRTLADGLSNAAQTMRIAALEAILQPGATELETAQAAQRVVGAAIPLLGPMITDMLLLQIRRWMETDGLSVSELAEGHPTVSARPVAVAFADLVGFTRLGEQMPPEELEELANRLATLAREVAEPPVRFVKAIGDAVMLVCPDPVPLLRAMLTLAGAAESDPDFPRLRVGLAYGQAVTRAGDWFGSPVNLASRVTGAARPGAVLVSEAARDAIGDADGFTWSFAGARFLKGIRGDTKLFRARPAESVTDLPAATP